MAPRAHFEQPINPGKLQKEASPTEVLEQGAWPRGTVACLVSTLPWLTQQVTFALLGLFVGSQQAMS